MTEQKSDKVRDAYQAYARELYPDWATNKDIATEYMTAEMGFEAGAKWQAEQDKNKAIAFADWIRDNTVTDGAPLRLYKGSRLTTTQLYELFTNQPS